MNDVSRWLSSALCLALVGALPSCSDSGTSPPATDASDPVDGPDSDVADVDPVDAERDPDVSDTLETSDVDAAPEADAPLELLADGVAVAGACTDRTDLALLEDALPRLPLAFAYPCATFCAGQRERETCTAFCVAEREGFGSDCAACAAAHGLCVVDTCREECSIDSGGRISAACRQCSAASCDPDFVACGGTIAEFEPPGPRTCDSELPRELLASGEAFVRMVDWCWDDCVASPTSGTCVAECMEPDMGECSECMGEYAVCALECSACASDPGGWSCKECAGLECADGLSNCAGIEVVIGWQGQPEGSLRFVNANARTPSATLIVGSDGVPVFRRVPYGESSAPVPLPAGDHLVGLTAGEFGTIDAALATTVVAVVADRVRTVVAAPGLGESARLIVPLSEPETPGTAEVRLVNGRSDGVVLRIRNADGSPPGVRVEPGTDEVIAFADGADGTWEFDLDDDGTYAWGIDAGAVEIEGAATWVVFSDDGSPSGINIVSFRGNGSTQNVSPSFRDGERSP